MPKPARRQIEFNRYKDEDPRDKQQPNSGRGCHEEQPLTGLLGGLERKQASSRNEQIAPKEYVY